MPPKLNCHPNIYYLLSDHFAFKSWFGSNISGFILIKNILITQIENEKVLTISLEYLASGDRSCMVGQDCEC